MGAGSRKTGVYAYALLVPLFLVSVSGQSSSSCSSYAFSSNKKYDTCIGLSQLKCFLHWTYNASDGTADIAFRATGISLSGNWVAWALNPTGEGMPGAQALVAFASSSSGSISPYTSAVQGRDPTTRLTKSALSFAVSGLAGEGSGSEMIIFAKIQLPGNRTSINHVWQVGPLSGGSPDEHSHDNEHALSLGTLDFSSGTAQTAGGGASASAASRLKRKNIHGVLNAVSWGTLLPIGFIIARYLRVFADPAWFYLHIACQTSAYVVGIAGWGIGLKLGSESPGTTYDAHRFLGFAICILATLQVLALLLRPKKENKYRSFWNFYHHGVGYIVIVLSVINVFKGLDILDPEKKWKTIYIVILVVLACVAVFLEVVTWIVVIKRKKKDGPHQKQPYAAQDAYG